MTLPANIRVNVSAPFPALVKGSGLIAVGKSNGVWTVSFNALGLGVQTPPQQSYQTDYLIVYDSIAQTWFRWPLSAIALMATTRAQRSIRSAADLPIQAGDGILNVNINTALAITVPGFATRFGAPLTIKNMATSTANCTLTPSGSEKIDNQTSLTLPPGASVNLVPFNDVVNNGWAIE